MPDGNLEIPTQFIVGAFCDRKIVLNPAYQKEYNNPDAIKCENNINISDRKTQKKIFMREYSRNKLRTFFREFKSRFQRKTLPPGEEQRESVEDNSKEINGGKSLEDLYREQLQQGIDTNAMLQQSSSEVKEKSASEKSDEYENKILILAGGRICYIK